MERMNVNDWFEAWMGVRYLRYVRKVAIIREFNRTGDKLGSR